MIMLFGLSGAAFAPRSHPALRGPWAFAMEIAL
jgi:hypothetical protein